MGWASQGLKIGMLAITFYGAVESADVIWTIGDIGYGSLGWLNMVCLLLLSPVVRKVARDYDAQRGQGLDPRFDPVSLGITGADFWAEEAQPERATDTAPPGRSATGPEELAQ